MDVVGWCGGRSVEMLPRGPAGGPQQKPGTGMGEMRATEPQPGHGERDLRRLPPELGKASQQSRVETQAVWRECASSAVCLVFVVGIPTQHCLLFAM